MDRVVAQDGESCSCAGGRAENEFRYRFPRFEFDSLARPPRKRPRDRRAAVRQGGGDNQLHFWPARKATKWDRAHRRPCSAMGPKRFDEIRRMGRRYFTSAVFSTGCSRSRPAWVWSGGRAWVTRTVLPHPLPQARGLRNDQARQHLVGTPVENRSARWGAGFMRARILRSRETVRPEGRRPRRQY